jgi:hypothetical protein
MGSKSEREDPAEFDADRWAKYEALTFTTAGILSGRENEVSTYTLRRAITLETDAKHAGCELSFRKAAALYRRCSHQNGARRCSLAALQLSMREARRFKTGEGGEAGEFAGCKLMGWYREATTLDRNPRIGDGIESRAPTAEEIEAKVQETGKAFCNGGQPAPYAPLGIRCVPDEEEGCYWLRRVVTWESANLYGGPTLVPVYDWEDCGDAIRWAYCDTNRGEEPCTGT